MDYEKDFRDGASKFVRGDAIAGILITVINVIGGIVVGMVQGGLDFSGAAETFTFDTGTSLGTDVAGGVTFGPTTILATASQGTAFTYLFTSNDPTNFAITVTNDNEISVIPPRLLNAATFEIEGEIRVGAITKGTRTFTMLIAASTPCLSPVANICS